MKLIIGNKNYSSWSLRAWLLAAVHDLSFEEVRVALSRQNTATEIAVYSDAGKVPVLHDKDLVIWDSFAICEYISERYLDGRGWPASAEARAVARSCSAEMHSGFFALREQMPMNCRATNREVDITAELQKDIFRIDSLWSWLRHRYSAQGSWLFGEFSIADCMFAPVVFRFNTYNTKVSVVSRKYMEYVLAQPKVQLWWEQAKNEKEIIEEDEAGLRLAGK